MSGWKKLAVAATTALTLTALVIMTGGAATALRAVGAGALAGSPVDAQAGGGATTGPGVGPIRMSIGPDWTLLDKLALTGTLTVTCGPFLPSPGNSSSAFVNVSEASGHTISHAGGSLTLACDGVTHAYAVTVTASNVPFRPGRGSATASAFACGVDPVSFQFECLNAQAGPQAISIRK